MKLHIRLFLLFVFCSALSLGQEENSRAEEKLIVKSLGGETGDDAFSIDTKEQVTVQGGGVSVTYGDVSLTCDSVVVYFKEEEVYAEGNVIMTDGDLRVTAEKVYYNFKQHHGVLEKARVISGLRKEGETVQWIVGADRLIRENRDVFTAEDAYITTCNFKVPHYRLKCSSITFIPGSMITARNMVLYLGKVPVFYYPWFRHDLKHNWLPYDFKLGSSSRLGDYLITRWKIWSNDVFAVLLRLDLTADRGNGIGLDAEYDSHKGMDGKFSFYTVTDPLGYERNRMRLTWKHYQKSEKSPYILRADIYSYSDREFGRDFFNDEYKSQIEYTPFFQFRQLLDMGELDLIYAFRTDAFQNEVKYYKPALFFGIGPYELFPDGYITLETHNSKTGLAYDELLAIPEIERERFNAMLKASYYADFGPIRFDFHAGEVFSRYDEYLIPVDSSLRNQLFWEIETGTTFTGDFKVSLGNVTGLRHTVEPYIKCFRGYEPSIDNGAVDQLDLYDDVREDLYLQPGFLTTLQAREKNGFRDLISFEAFFRYYDNDDYAVANNGGEHWGDIGFRLFITPIKDLGFYSQGEVDQGDAAFEELYSGIRYKLSDRLVVHLEDYRSRTERGAIFGFEACANEKWSMGGFLRYDIDDEEYSEWRWFVTRIFHMWELTFIGNYERKLDERTVGVKLKLIGGNYTDISERQGSIVAPDRIDDYLFLGREL